MIKVSKVDDGVMESVIDRTDFCETSMEDIVGMVHKSLQRWPSARVTMIRPVVRSVLTEGSRDNPHAFELDDALVKVFRDDLEGAVKLFAPIEQTIRVSPVVPRLEKGDASNEPN